jgi:hypothetical protein
VIAGGAAPAEELLEDYCTRWGNSIDPVFTDYAYSRSPRRRRSRDTALEPLAGAAW